ncbi:hypothetical protein BYT27DRAFT_7237288 [Phlegmacium glaucopus]|nr:hypothetical protein BYT27DRAFT_7237288 [Phlegmacium glaucopus]
MSGTSSQSEKSDFSAPWLRADLLNTPTYIGSHDFASHVIWTKTGNQNELMLVPDDPSHSPASRATCAVVGIISPHRLSLEAHGNFNPSFEHATLETAKAQFQLIPPVVYTDFITDFALGIQRMETLQNSATTGGPHAQHFVIFDDQNKGLKFSWPLFEKRTMAHDPSDMEDWSNGYPISNDFKDAFNSIIPKWRVTPLPAFDATGKFIQIHDLEASLSGSLVLVYFQLKHYAIKDKKTNEIASNTFTAIATQIKILEPAAKRKRSPYKSLMLKGPTVLPQSPTKKKNQINAVNAFHSATNIGNNANLSAGPSRSKREEPMPQPSSKADSKKRLIDEDEDPTATEGESSVSDSPLKKKKKQTT